MDIKILLDDAVAAGINLQNEDCVSDLEDVWLKSCLNDYEWVELYLPDFLCDLDLLDLYKIASESQKAYDDTQWLQDYSRGHDHTGLNLAYCTSAAMRTNEVGAVIVKKIIAGAKTVVAENLQEWYWECRRYVLESEECNDKECQSLTSYDN